MGRRARLVAALALAAAVAGCGNGGATIPRDVFVMAMQIDDVISLDPAEVFEFTGAEVTANLYDRLLYFDLDDPTKLVGGLVETWSVSDDGRAYTLRIRPGVRFQSGNPVTARDAAYSLQRVVRLNLSPAFILAQFGFRPETVGETIRAADDRTLLLTTDRAYAPSFFLACLTAAVSSVVDSRVVKAHEANGDMGHGWLKTHSAGSGPFELASWKPNEIIMLDRFDGYWRGRPAMRKVMIRHIAEPGIQRLLLERGDIDVARNLGPDHAAAVAGNPRLRVRYVRKGALYYLGLNQKNAVLRRRDVREALRYLVDYDGIIGTLMRGAAAPHEAFVPLGYLGALDDRPFALDVARARRLLREAGVPEGTELTLDVRGMRPDLDVAQSLQATFAKAGLRLRIVPGDGKQVLTKYRARNHDIFFGRWGPDYQDPNSNAQAFAFNPDNSDSGLIKTLAWRNGWQDSALTRMTEQAILERDPAKRAALYRDMQRREQADSPFVILFQEVEITVERNEVHGFVIGPSFDTIYYRGVTKD